MKRIEYSKNNKKWFTTKLLKFNDLHSIIQVGDNVSVGLSGGVDSVTLLFLLEYLKRFSHLKFNLTAIHVNVYEKCDTKILKDYCDELEIEFFDIGIKKTDLPVPHKGICYTCSKLRKGAMIEYLKEKKINKLALGHHSDDLAETLLMNMDYHRTVDSLKPVSFLDRNDFTLLRPMLCMSKREIEVIHNAFQLPILDYYCGYEEKNMREKYRNLLDEMSSTLPNLKANISEAFLKMVKEA